VNEEDGFLYVTCIEVNMKWNWETDFSSDYRYLKGRVYIDGEEVGTAVFDYATYEWEYSFYGPEEELTRTQFVLKENGYEPGTEDKYYYRYFPLFIVESKTLEGADLPDICDPEEDSEPVFDFSEFEEGLLPSGSWTIDQLLEQYGTPESIEAYYDPGSGLVEVSFVHEDIRVDFLPMPAERFSIYCEESDYFDLSDEDRNIEMEVSVVFLLNKNIEYPRGLKIGESTKADVLEAYPDCDDGLKYLYGFFDEDGILTEKGGGIVEYLFDENEVLNVITCTFFRYPPLI
jgi:hypothetical protein